MSRHVLMRLFSALAGICFLAGSAIAEDHAVEWKVLETAKVSLEKGLGAAQGKGRPISAKFEMEDGKLQLSTYTASKGKYAEVIVDHMSGKVAKTEEIKEGEDLTHAVEQSKAMAKAKTSLRSAVTKAVAANPGYRALSAIPSMQGASPVATIVLENASGTKTVTEGLN